MCGKVSENSGEIVNHPAPAELMQGGVQLKIDAGAGPAPASIFNQFTKYKMGPFLAKIKQTKPGSL